MPVRTLPIRPDVDSLKQQARCLHQSLKAHDPAAIDAGAKPELVNTRNERIIPQGDEGLIGYLLSIGALLD